MSIRVWLIGLAATSPLEADRMPSAGPPLAPLPTLQDIAEFWTTVFSGPAPYGVPALDAVRFNERIVNNCTVWDVQFDSYKDPEADLPVRLGGVLAVPNAVPPPGPGGTYPGLIVTHSVGVGPPDGPAPDDVEAMSTWFALKGYAVLAYYMRGWGTSQMSVSADLFTDYLATETGQPLDARWAGMAVDAFQAGEFLAQQTEVWDSDGLVYVGHSGGGYAVLAGAVFSNRIAVACASAPAGAWPSAGDWLDYVWGNGGFLSIQSWVNAQPDPAFARSLVERTLAFISMYNAIDNPFLTSINPEWSLDGTAIFFYGGQADPSIPPWDVEANFLLANPSDIVSKAFHWSPTGGHGGLESWDRTQAWVAGHYPNISLTAPIAALTAMQIDGASVTLSSAGSQAWQYDWAFDGGQMSSDESDIVSWQYDFGDGSTMHWGSSIGHSYASAGTYDVTLTITDGAGLQSQETIMVTVDEGSGTNAQLEVIAESPEVIPEGASGQFIVRLTEHPEGNVTVTTERISGDTDITVAGGATLVFTPGNWDDFQTVTLAAAQDPDQTSDSATIALSAPGLTNVEVTAIERDDEAEFTIAVGSGAGTFGEFLFIPITLLNPHNAPVESLSFTLEFNFDDVALSQVERGADLPGPAFWEFSSSIPSAGMQVVTAFEFVQPADPIIAGTIADDGFTIFDDSPPGVVPLTLTAASVNGLSAGMESGNITVNDGIPVASSWALVILAALLASAAACILTLRHRQHVSGL